MLPGAHVLGKESFIAEVLKWAWCHSQGHLEMRGSFFISQYIPFLGLPYQSTTDCVTSTIGIYLLTILDIQDQGVGRAGFFCGLSPQLVDGHFSLSSYGLLYFHLVLYICASFLSLTRTLIWFMNHPNSTWFHLNTCFNYICKIPISKNILGFWIDMNLGRPLFNPL